MIALCVLVGCSSNQAMRPPAHKPTTTVIGSTVPHESTTTSITVVTSTVPGSADYRPPIGALNPNVTQATIRTTICVSGWTATVRPPASYTTALKLQQLKARHMPETAAQVEEDHMVALELGGSPTDPNNLWPEPRVGAHASAGAKDLAENRLKREVCAGTITLAEAQLEIKIPADWHG